LSTPPDRTEHLTEVVSRLLPVLLRTLDALDQVQRHTHPGRFEQLGETLEQFRPDMTAMAESFEKEQWPDELEGFQALLAQATREIHAALERCALAHASPDPFIEWMRGMRGRSVAMEALYPLSAAFSPISRFFLEPSARTDEALLGAIEAGTRVGAREDDQPAVGVMNANNSRKERGGFSLYVPEYYQAGQTWPLVVALHGGSGHGADFLWTWLREARSRGFILLSPTARDGTWSLMGDDIDAEPIHQMVEYVCEHWNVDRDRVLLTGMSDGGTYTTLLGLAQGSPFTALGALCGVFHPMNQLNGNLARVPGRRVYLLHGALDWMFPAETARTAYDQLLAAGADVTYREVPDLSHTYPRDENDALLRWFDSSLALPTGAEPGAVLE
jgi:phospholipase/carboxylesterase